MQGADDLANRRWHRVDPERRIRAESNFDVQVAVHFTFGIRSLDVDRGGDDLLVVLQPRPHLDCELAAESGVLVCGERQTGVVAWMLDRRDEGDHGSVLVLI